MGAPVSQRAILSTVATMILSAATAYGLSMASAWLCETLAHDLRMGFTGHLCGLELAEMERLNAGEQVSKLQNEIGEVALFLRNNLFSFVDDAIRFCGTFAWMLWLNPKLALLAHAPVVVLLWYTAVSSRIIGDAAHESQRQKARMNGFADTLITVFPVMRLFDAARLVRGEYSAALEGWQAANVREEKRKARLMSLSAMLSCIPLMLLFLIGGTQIIGGSTTIGILYVFINLSGNVSGVLMNMPGRIAQFRRFSANVQRLAPSISISREEYP